MSRSKPTSGLALPLAWLTSALVLALLGWLPGHTSSPSTYNFANYYADGHRGVNFSLAAVFAMLGAIYFAIGRRASRRFWWHLAWGQFALTLVGTLLMESPALAFSLSRSPWNGEAFVVAFHFWSTVSAAGYLAIWAGLLLFGYLAFAGLWTRKSARS